MPRFRERNLEVDVHREESIIIVHRGVSMKDTVNGCGSYLFTQPFQESRDQNLKILCQIAVLSDTPEDARGGVLCDAREEPRTRSH